MMKVLVTGSKGFLGQHLLKELIKNNFKILSFDKIDGQDIVNWNDLVKTPDFDILIHLAARSYVPDSYKNSRDFFIDNLVGTINALELCKLKRAKFIYLSSYVYGIPQYLPIDEKHPVEALNPYAATKIESEAICNYYYQFFKIPIIIFRPFNIYGFGQNEKFLIPNIINQVSSGHIHLLDPIPRRDYVYISDVISAILKAIWYKCEFEIYNVASGRSYTIEDIVNKIISLVNKQIKVNYSLASRENEVYDTIADISKIQNHLNWEPKIELEEGLMRMIDAYYENNSI